jgi:hypothetical protein
MFAIPHRPAADIEIWAENATPLERDQALRLAVHDKNAKSVAVLLRRGAYVNTMRLPRENSDDSKTLHNAQGTKKPGTTTSVLFYPQISHMCWPQFYLFTRSSALVVWEQSWFWRFELARSLFDPLAPKLTLLPNDQCTRSREQIELRPTHMTDLGVE